MSNLSSELLALHTEARACRRCQEAGYPIVLSAVLSGPASAKVMIVGQAPGASEAAAGRPFSGTSGRRLFEWLARVGWTEELYRDTQYLTAITKCYPGKGKGDKGDRVPSRAEQRLCAPFLERELQIVCPRVLVPVGGLAVRRFLGQVKLSEVVGHVYQRDSAWVVPLPHPSGASLWLNRPENQDRLSAALDHAKRLCREHGLPAERQ